MKQLAAENCEKILIKFGNQEIQGLKCNGDVFITPGSLGNIMNYAPSTRSKLVKDRVSSTHLFQLVKDGIPKEKFYITVSGIEDVINRSGKSSYSKLAIDFLDFLKFKYYSSESEEECLEDHPYMTLEELTDKLTDLEESCDKELAWHTIAVQKEAEVRHLARDLEKLTDIPYKDWLKHAKEAVQGNI